ncbi:hypothetical protein [Micromonospora sagamiensis]|uniref:Uncharacterized protein n=1 Tax=Micromonospora sagamiensis TaxID=47875 RepID=A0A562WF32_9ACTN|nr:hypothetical protein [Micromonospora sagamiensis]TWJ28788.1 hypothetical protein JD81_02294 [Micromonospora sagamiensis]BCL12306.1 hypothetical protein GCM10017556_00450 [Micromonospora sagamiensis]
MLSGLTAPLPAHVRYAGVVAVAVVGLFRELGLVSLRLPQNARQVPQDVLQRSPRRGALQFGFELGTGVRTYVSASAPYVLAAALLLVGQRLEVAVLAGVGFGVGRALTPLTRRAAGSGDRWDAELRVRLRTITVTGCAVLVVAATLLTARQW